MLIFKDMDDIMNCMCLESYLHFAPGPVGLANEADIDNTTVLFM